MKILIIDENEVARRHLFWALRKEHDLHEAVSREEALATFQTLAPDAVVMELLEEHDPDEGAGLALVERMMAEPEPPSILITTRPDRKEAAARLLALGVVDIFIKPVQPEEIQMVLRRVEGLRKMRAAGGKAPTGRTAGGPPLRPDAPLTDGSDIIGVDKRIKQIMYQVRRIAPTPVSVLITGETGTGKEVFAQAIHNLSDRARRRMVPLNCAVLSDTLVEDELFGHEKGAFTGAVERRKGKFESAHQGTLFLDEIGDLSPRLQGKFLRVLQEHTFERLGGNEPIDTDFRLISATHHDLTQLTREGAFREDLMFRINVVSFHLPPLRERRGDIKLLSARFLEEYTRIFNRPGPLSFTREVERFLIDYPWPGNVRELKHFVERAVALSEGRRIGPEALPESFSPAAVGESLAEGKGNFDTLIKKYRHQLVMEALETTGNNKVQTAQLLGISKSYLFKLIKQFSAGG